MAAGLTVEQQVGLEVAAVTVQQFAGRRERPIVAVIVTGQDIGQAFREQRPRPDAAAARRGAGWGRPPG